MIERAALCALLEPVLGGPVELDVLKDKPGRRITMRARGRRARAIVKIYASQRAPTVAGRVRGLAGGPPEPVVPEVLMLDEALHLVVLSEVPGTPLSGAFMARDAAACARAGRALGVWHRAWEGTPEGPHRSHTPARELEILEARIDVAPDPLATEVRARLAELPALVWGPATVIHRDLYEEQIMLGERIGLIDLDDSALGPPELDLGNLLGHLLLLERRSGVDLAGITETFLQAYREAGPPLDDVLLGHCRELSLLRLACIHADPSLVPAAGEADAASTVAPALGA